MKLRNLWQKLRDWAFGAGAAKAGPFGPYALGEKLGEGGMGVVYRATHVGLERPVAIKLLREKRRTPDDEARFEREAKLTSRLRHPNTVSVYDSGRTPDGAPYYVMEYLGGLDLERLVVEQGPLSPARTVRVLRQVCGALGELHALGLVHRDIKPANIVLGSRAGEQDVAKVVDFGLARAAGDDSDETSVISGTPLYLAPEAVTQPASVDARADIYALGAVAYFLLTGQHVFQGSSVVEVLGGHLFEAPVPPSERLGEALPAALEALVLGCLAKDPAGRPASTEALLAELSALADARPAGPVVGQSCDFAGGPTSIRYGRQRVRLLEVAATERYRSAGVSLDRRTASLAEERLAG